MNRPHAPNSNAAPTIGRRRFLQGVGACVGLPLFESLAARSAVAAEATATPALATTASGAPLRMAFMSIPNGVQQEHWFPTGQGSDFSFNSTMKPLEAVKQHVQVLTGLDHEHATPGPDGAGDHARANATFLTGQRARKTAGKDIYVGVSVDQLAAQHVGHTTRFRSLELSCDAVRNSGSCDSGYACAYQYNLSWSTPTTPVTPEPNPRLAFERLFGGGAQGQRARNYQQRLETQRSLLDFVLEDARSLNRELSGHDRRKLDEYLAGVRSIERRIQNSEQFESVADPAVDTPPGIPRDFGAHMDMMYDLLAMAFQTDSTRVGTLLLAYDGSNRSFPDLGISEGHHYLTHHQRNEKYVEYIAKIDQFYMQRFARFLEKLAATEDVDGASLLDNSMIVYGGAIANGNRHTHDNLPVVLAGGGGGSLRPGRYVELDSQPMSNLFVSMLNSMGVGVDRFGDSTAQLAGL
ncbi:hypothetical protein KOR34_39630 [Posidoniimonas corsicana]|uniref:DUF1552 domain-containing protein n=1 Tax=Posidoniimonas corsicana TaxID=1938618 RepID=A0A5C5V375_9BACT|nr:DUF1552 domain-containing protein [Posidoniimonas corsicana]TWT32202.1 hypothetical protein KOR34_39630 [Posidoniimonas corsicana]